MVHKLMRLANSVRRVLVVAYLIGKQGFSAWLSYAASAVLNLWLFALFFAVGSSISMHILVGASIATIFSTCIGSALIESYHGLLGFRDFLLVSPLTRYELRVAISLGHLIPSLAMCTPYIALLIIEVGDAAKAFSAFAISASLAWAVATTLSYAAVKRDVVSSGRIADIISSAMLYLPPVYYPPTLLPENIRLLALAAPTYNISQLAKAALGIEHLSPQEIVVHVTAYAIELAILVVIAKKRMSQAEE